MVIPFNGRTTTSVGRNGTFKSTGLIVEAQDYGSDASKHTFTLEGLTSRGNAATGHLNVPVAEMPAVIAAMQELLHGYHHAQGTAYGYEPVITLPHRADGRIITALPCGREIHIHRDNENTGTILDVFGGPNAEQPGESVTLYDADNAYDSDAEEHCVTCQHQAGELIAGQCSECFFKAGAPAQPTATALAWTCPYCQHSQATEPQLEEGEQWSRCPVCGGN